MWGQRKNFWPPAWPFQTACLNEFILNKYYREKFYASPCLSSVNLQHVFTNKGATSIHFINDHECTILKIQAVYLKIHTLLLFESVGLSGHLLSLQSSFVFHRFSLERYS